MSIEDLSLDMGFDAEASRRKVDTSGTFWNPRSFDQRDKTRLLGESLGLQSSGTAFGENILRYDVMARGGLTQESYSEKKPGPDLHEQPHGDLQDYDIRLQALPAGKINATGYASRLDSRIPRPFLPSLNQERSRYGGGIFYNDAKLPMQLTWDSTRDNITSGRADLRDDEDRDEGTLHYETTWQPTENHSLRLEYEYQQTEDRYSGTRTRFGTTRNFFAINDVVQFGEQNKNRLETLVRMEDDSGDLAQDTFEVAPQLRLQHTDSLFTTYRVQYLKESFERLDAKTFRADTGITHQLGGVLTSSFNLYGLRQQANCNADTTEWGGLTDFAFAKDNSLGRFSSNLSYVHSQTRTDDGQRDGVVIGEAATFRDPLPVTLAHAQVDIFSVVVTAADHLQVYVPIRDFVVIPAGRYTLLARVPTGMIVDRQTVLVSYRYRTFNNFELNRDRVDLRVQQDFKMGLTPYYAGTYQEENRVHGGLLTWQDHDIERHRIGATYRGPRWSVGPEWEYNDDAVDPYTAGHLNGDVVILQTARQQLDGQMTLSRFLFDGEDCLPGHHTTLLDTGLTYRYFLASNLEVNGGAMYRFEDDSQFGRTNGVDLTGSLSYKIGLFTVLVELEYDSLQLPGSDDEGVALWVKLRREIPVIGKQTQ